MAIPDQKNRLLRTVHEPGKEIAQNITGYRSLIEHESQFAPSADGSYHVEPKASPCGLYYGSLSHGRPGRTGMEVGSNAGFISEVC